MYLEHPQIKKKKKNWTKIWKKKKNKKKKITKPSPRRAQQHITEVENPQILKKKKKKPTQRIRNQTHGHVAGRENQTPIQSIQSKSKTNSNTEVFIKKKKKKTQYRANQNQTQYKGNQTHGYVTCNSLVVIVNRSLAPRFRRSSLAPHRRSQIDLL